MKKSDKSPLILKITRWFYPKLERVVPQLAFKIFTRLFFTPLHYVVPEKERKAEAYATITYLSTKTKKIKVYSWGDGSKYILLIHGWGGRATQFRRFVKPLMGAGYRVVGFDGPAHGNSSGTTTNIIEFEETIRKIYQNEGVPQAVITHSFGGGAALFSAVNGLPIPSLITIAMPSIGDEIIRVYLKALNASPRTGEYFKAFMLAKFKKPFDEFTAGYFVRQLKGKLTWLLIHDEDDKEVSIQHANLILKTDPTVQFHKTQGLGHTRILKDDNVIARCVKFIQTST